MHSETWSSSKRLYYLTWMPIFVFFKYKLKEIDQIKFDVNNKLYSILRQNTCTWNIICDIYKQLIWHRLEANKKERSTIPLWCVHPFITPTCLPTGWFGTFSPMPTVNGQISKHHIRWTSVHAEKSFLRPDGFVRQSLLIKCSHVNRRVSERGRFTHSNSNDHCVSWWNKRKVLIYWYMGFIHMAISDYYAKCENCLYVEFILFKFVSTFSYLSKYLNISLPT